MKKQFLVNLPEETLNKMDTVVKNNPEFNGIRNNFTLKAINESLTAYTSNGKLKKG